MKDEAEKPERVRTRKVAAMTGLSARTVQLMAAQGRIPGAAKLGVTWTFSERAVRYWIKRQEALAEAEACRRNIGVSTSIDKTFERLIKRKKDKR